MSLHFAAAAVKDTRPLCSKAHFFSGKWYFVGDSGTVAVGNLWDLSSFIIELYGVTDIC